MNNTLTAGRRLAPFAAAALAAAAFAGPASAQTSSPIAVDAAHDSVTVNGLGFGQATLQVARPDVVTGKPVVIGQYSALSLGQPFTVNTTAPSLLHPNGDCWQAGALSLPNGQGLVPDVLPGDSVGIAGQSVTVPAEGFDYEAKTGGPIAGCDTVSLWARNMVDGATFASPGSDLAVTGEAQPLATGVQATATDGTHTTAPVDAKLGTDGRWTATIPASELTKLDDGTIKVNGIYAVPDVATGAAARIAGRTFSVDKQTPKAAPAPAPAPAPAAPAPKPSIKLAGLMMPKKISLAAARAGKLKVSFIVPTNAKYVRVRLARPGHTAALMILPAAQAGSRQTVKISKSQLRNKLSAGRFTVTVGAGATKTQLGSPVIRGAVRIK
jgi:hypothetical protein